MAESLTSSRLLGSIPVLQTSKEKQNHKNLIGKWLCIPCNCRFSVPLHSLDNYTVCTFSKRFVGAQKACHTNVYRNWPSWLGGRPIGTLSVASFTHPGFPTLDCVLFPSVTWLMTVQRDFTVLNNCFLPMDLFFVTSRHHKHCSNKQPTQIEFKSGTNATQEIAWKTVYAYKIHISVIKFPSRKPDVMAQVWNPSSGGPSGDDGWAWGRRITRSSRLAWDTTTMTNIKTKIPVRGLQFLSSPTTCMMAFLKPRLTW